MSKRLRLAGRMDPSVEFCDDGGVFLHEAGEENSHGMYASGEAVDALRKLPRFNQRTGKWVRRMVQVSNQVPRITPAELRALRSCVAAHVSWFSSEGARRLQAVARRALDKLSGKRAALGGGK